MILPSLRLDPIGAFIYNSHRLLGHDKTAALINMPAGNKQMCKLCIYEQNPNPSTHADVQRALQCL